MLLFFPVNNRLVSEYMKNNLNICTFAWTHADIFRLLVVSNHNSKLFNFLKFYSNRRFLVNFIKNNHNFRITEVVAG